MSSERQRLLELALESLEHKKKQLDAEIAEITSELKGSRARKPVAAPPADSAKKRARFSKEECRKRSQRMKTYWNNWRKQNNKVK